MKFLLTALLSFVVFVIFSCQTNDDRSHKNKQKAELRRDFYIKKKDSVFLPAEIHALIKSNKNFVLLLNGFKQEQYSSGELKDIAEQNLKHIDEVLQSKLPKKIDTDAVKSRIVLAKMTLKRLIFLLNKKEIEKDSVQRTYDYLLKNINALITQMKVYAENKDEFDEIINLFTPKDSINPANNQKNNTVAK